MDTKMHRDINNPNIEEINSIAQSFGLSSTLINELLRMGEGTYNKSQINCKIDNILKKYLER